MIGNRTKRKGQPEPAVADSPESGTGREHGGVVESPDNSTVPDDLAAEADRLRSEAAEHRGRAERGQTEAQAIITAGDEEAARVKATATQKSLAAEAESAAEAREADRLTERAGVIAAAAAEQEKGDAAVQLGAALAVERAQLLETLADLDAMLAGFRAERERAEAVLADAGADSDTAAAADAAGSAELRLTGIAKLEGKHTQDRLQAATRLQELGDASGTAGGEFGDACAAAARHYAKARNLLNQAFPSRPEAVRDRTLEELYGAIEGNRQRIADEAAAAKAQPRQIAYL